MTLQSAFVSLSILKNLTLKCCRIHFWMWFMQERLWRLPISGHIFKPKTWTLNPTMGQWICIMQVCACVCGKEYILLYHESTTKNILFFYLENTTLENKILVVVIHYVFYWQWWKEYINSRLDLFLKYTIVQEFYFAVL